MDAQFSKTSPSTINQAIFNLAVRYRAIYKQASIYSNTYNNTSSKFSCIEIITGLQNIGKSIEIGGGRETWKEYYEYLEAFAIGLSEAKKLNIDAVREIIATEIRNIQAEIALKQRESIEEQQRIERQAELFSKLAPRVLAGIVIIIAASFIGYAIWEMMNRKVTNEQKVEQVIGENNQLKQENSALKTENQTLKQEAESFKKFQQERKKLSAIQAENARLKEQNQSLNNRIYMTEEKINKFKYPDVHPRTGLYHYARTHISAIRHQKHLLDKAFDSWHPEKIHASSDNIQSFEFDSSFLYIYL
jgi:uncharacterized protein YlxW (UPF0749 family)